MIAFVPLILFSVLLNAIAQILLKKGMISVGELALSADFIIRCVFNPFILGGFGVYAISIISWLIVLSKVQVSIAYPFLAFGFVFSAVVAHFVFGESLGLFKMLGIGFICIGLVLLTINH